MTNYSLCRCVKCGKESALKDGVCPVCNTDTFDFIKFFEDTIKGNENDRTF